MALRARLIQRKSIHSLSTGTALLAALVACAGACAGGSPGEEPTGIRMLTADPEMIQVSPGGTGSARFVLTSGGVPIAGQPVTFTIVHDPETPEPETQGAMLLDASAVTDALGVASAEVRVDRPPVFQVHAAAGSAEADVAVIVADAVGNVVVVPFLAPTSNAYTRTSRIEVLLLDDRLCADIDLADPPRPSRGITGMESLPPSGGMARFESRQHDRIERHRRQRARRARRAHRARLRRSAWGRAWSPVAASRCRCRCTTPSPIRSGASP